MGTVGSLAFAMKQSHLSPSEQLALIIIADHCSEFFTIDEAVDVVGNATSIINPQEHVEKLISVSLIDSHPAYAGRYYVPEDHLPYSYDIEVSSRDIVKDLSGYVYLLQSPTKAYKIGKTVNPQSRFQTFRLALPFEVEYTCVIRTDRMSDLEKELHERFADKRINGEWFDLSPADVEYIKGLAQ